MNALVPQLLMLVFFIGIMYLFLIRPQKKKEKQIQEMRDGVQVGDEIITIGGICGKVVKTKEDTIVIQVGADKVKFEMTRWAVSSVVSKREDKKAEAKEAEEEKTEKKHLPKKLKKDAEGEEKAPETEEKTPEKNQ